MRIHRLEKLTNPYSTGQSIHRDRNDMRMSGFQHRRLVPPIQKKHNRVKLLANYFWDLAETTSEGDPSLFKCG